MKGILRAITKDEVGTLTSRLIPLENILHIKTSIRIKDSNESGVEKRGESEKHVEFDENELTLCFLDGSELSIDTTLSPYEFEVLNANGRVTVKTNSLVDLEEFLVAADLEEVKKS